MYRTLLAQRGETSHSQYRFEITDQPKWCKKSHYVTVCSKGFDSFIERCFLSVTFSASRIDGIVCIIGVHDSITFSLSFSLSSLEVLSCFFQLSTLAEDSCSASTSLALFSLKVCSSVSHFFALVLLPDRRDRRCYKWTG